MGFASEGERKAQSDFINDQKFWIKINRVEAHFGMGNFDEYKASREAAESLEHPAWIMQDFDGQIEKLRKLLQAKSDLLNPPWIEY